VHVSLQHSEGHVSGLPPLEKYALVLLPERRVLEKLEEQFETNVLVKRPEMHEMPVFAQQVEEFAFQALQLEVEVHVFAERPEMRVLVHSPATHALPCALGELVFLPHQPETPAFAVHHLEKRALAHPLFS
jgi:hypothetical protein